MTTPLPESRVIPAQLAFLSIYNPSLATSDETFRDQVLFYYSRADKEAKAARKANNGQEVSKEELREQENERLRQIGLAQGMVDFARSFSEGQPVDSVETEKSRIVMHELEDGWWVLASVDLTRLPKAKTLDAAAAAAAAGKKEEEVYEYSAREVSPPALLIQQIVTAHRTFLLHHGPSLDFLMGRLGREKMSSFLDRYWTRFARSWEVLMHDNPASEVLGGTKLSAGGELGMGVGEEEWGSGERAVLEDLVHRTDGLVDLLVSRFGEPKPDKGSKTNTDPEAELPWIGRGQCADVGDGVIFGGTGKLSRASIRDVSNWVQQIYMYGDYAYGVRDHPSRKRRKVPKRAPSSLEESTMPVADKNDATEVPTTSEDEAAQTGQTGQDLEADGEALDKVPSIPALPPDPRPTLHDRVASQDHAPGSPAGVPTPIDDHRPGIPPPIVTAAERSLHNATSKAGQTPSKPQPAGSEQESTFGISNDKWATYLTFGLNKLAKPSVVEKKAERPAAAARQSTTNTTTLRPSNDEVEGKSDAGSGNVSMKQVDPMPENFLVESKIAEQKHLETEGYFLIGYRGMLKGTKAMPLDEQKPGSDEDEDGGDRTVLRTVHVETVKAVDFNGNENEASDASSVETFKKGMTTTTHERLRVLVYIRRPFIYTFLFQQRNEFLQMTSFYSNLHHHLEPLQKPMSYNTSTTNVTRRIADSREPDPTDSPNSKGQTPPPVYDLLYDPIRLTVHSSIPNIPLPGTREAEGFSLTGDAASSWTRIEGLNVHSQILAILDSTRRTSREIEKSAKTSRGWWVVWMRLPPSTQASTRDLKVAAEDSVATDSAQPSARPSADTSFTQPDVFDTGDCRVAVLVRKASDWTPPKGSGGVRNFSGMMGWTGSDATGGPNAGWGPGLAGGMGFDPRRYVEGLLSLSR
ncbi:hypothetical protein C1H76_9349 [Elsinoe australis]|uniref:CCZ1/INTU/HSP4 first Longin domain-containing protein n=1 Tax=Elsinoe australis TaxID=40998 RepID=A0A4U7ALF2_9PEZI|nr:hypothetical protein C1H76_9349 [Elsinoe australis]